MVRLNLGVFSPCARPPSSAQVYDKQRNGMSAECICFRRCVLHSHPPNPTHAAYPAHSGTSLCSPRRTRPRRRRTLRSSHGSVPTMRYQTQGSLVTFAKLHKTPQPRELENFPHGGASACHHHHVATSMHMSHGGHYPPVTCHLHFQEAT